MAIPILLERLRSLVLSELGGARRVCCCRVGGARCGALSDELPQLAEEVEGFGRANGVLIPRLITHEGDEGFLATWPRRQARRFVGLRRRRAPTMEPSVGLLTVLLLDPS